VGKLRRLSGAEACTLLARHGFVEVRRRGSHAIMQARREGVTVTVPVPLHAELRIGTLQSIVRQSGLPREIFES